MLIFCLGPYIDDDSVALEDKHCDADVSKDLVGVPNFDIANNRLIVMNFLAQVAEHAAHADERDGNAEHDEVGEEGVGLDPADGQRWNRHSHDVPVVVGTVATIVFPACVVANYRINLRSNEVEVATAGGNLLNPNGDVHSPLSYPAKDL